jgi:crotonobetainyl-CoA:carnitine CoA-transferase CaiB-like acyl-CoA transferase
MEEDFWLTDSRFADDASRGKHSEMISGRMQQWTKTRTTVEVIEALDTSKT